MTALLTAHEAARLALGVNVIVRPGDREPKTHLRGIKTWDRRVAPQEWVALTGPCPTCEGEGKIPYSFGDDPDIEELSAYAWTVCPDCRDGRRIVPLYTECPQLDVHYAGDVDGWDECFYGCDDQHRLLVGRGSIEVVPLHEVGATCPHERHLCIVRKGLVWAWPSDDGNWYETTAVTLDPLPVPGRDFGIVMTGVEVDTAALREATG